MPKTEKSTGCLCPVCGTSIESNPFYCARCETPHHQDCWEYLGGCAVFGCEPGSERLPATQQEWSLLERSAQRALWFYRAYVFSLLGIGVGAAYSFVHGLLPSFFDFGSAGIFTLVFNILPSLFLLICLMTFLLSLLPAIFVRLGLSRSLAGTLSPPQKGRADIIERMELKGILGLCHRFLSVFKPSILMVLIFIVLIALVSLEHTLGFGDFFSLAITLSFILLPLEAARKHLVYLASLQNRFIVSFKEKKPRD